MTVQDLGAIGELISAIAVVVTLVYLAIQVKAAKDHAITSTNFQSAQALRDELTVFMEPALLRSALVKAFEAPSDLSADEEMVMDAWLQLTMHMREAEYYEAKRGTFPAERWEASKQIIRMNLAAKWSREW